MDTEDVGVGEQLLTRSRQELVAVLAVHIKGLARFPLLDAVRLKLPWRNEAEREIIFSINPAEIAAILAIQDAQDTPNVPTHEINALLAEYLDLMQTYLEGLEVPGAADLAANLRLPDVAEAARTLARRRGAFRTPPRTHARPQASRSRRTVRVRARGSRRARAPGRLADDDPEPPPPLGRLLRALTRLLGGVR